MKFGLLGPLEVIDDLGSPIDLGGTQARLVVAALLAAGGRMVTADALVDIIWGDDPPASASGTLQSYISRLRRRFGEAAELLWEPPGYRLAVAPDDVDYRRFEALADEGRSLLGESRFDDAADTLRAADGLWRGPALVEFADRDFAAGLAVRLEERRGAALEDRFTAELALGRHNALIGELTELVSLYPVREGLRAALALALYRAGRQADALRSLNEARSYLRDELGVDPGPALRELETAILDHDPALALPRASVATAAAPAAENIIGRDAELAQLRASLAEAATSTRAVVVEGEPGIGKTRLVEELAADAAAKGMTVLWGRAFEGGAAPAFWPWLAPLRALGDPFSDAGAAAGEQARFVLLEKVAALLAAAAAERPVMIVLDDIQWADEPSLDLLALLTTRLTDVPLLLACTVRELEVGRNDAVVDTLASLSRLPGTRRLRLRGLSPAATTELVARATGQAVAPDVAAMIHHRAEGNPFFAAELARLFASGDTADVPSGVRDVVRRRLALLSPMTNELLGVAAVIGRDVDLSLLARASGHELDAVLDGLDPAVVHRLLVPIDDQPGAYRFSHALVREVVVDDISSLKRARLHLKVAEALEQTDDTAEIVAEHLWAAVPIGAGRRAAEALERAAQVARRRLAYRSAKHLLERAVQLRRSVGSAPEDLEAELNAVAALVSVTADCDGYASLPGTPLLARGKQLAEMTGRTREVVDLLWAEWAGLDVACEYQRAHAIAEELLARAEDMGPDGDDPMVFVIGHTAYGIRCWHLGELSESSRHLDLAREAARKISAQYRELLFDLDQLRLAVPFSVTLHDLVGDLDDPERAYEEALREVPGDSFWELLVMNFAASGAIATGDFERGERAARRGMAVDPEAMSAFWSEANRAYLGIALCMQGKLDEGLPLLDEGWTTYRSMGLRTNATSWLGARAQALADHGRVEEALASLAEAERALEETAEWYSQPIVLTAAAAVRRAQGADEAEVAAILQRAIDLAVQQGGHGIARRVSRTAAAYGLERG